MRAIKFRRLRDQDPPSQEKVCQITTDVVGAIFGRDSTAILRVSGLPMQLQQMKNFKFRSAQQRQLQAAGLHVPADFNPAWFFYTFQIDCRTLLASAPLKIHDLEQWLWMLSRWLIAEFNDMTKRLDFLHVLSQIDSVPAL